MSIQSILLAYDGSQMSKRAASVAGEMAVRLEAAIEVVHVLRLPLPTVTVEVAVPTPAEVEAEFREAALALLEEAKNLLPAERSPKATLLEGSPGSKLSGYAQSSGCDLIVIGHRGLNGLERLFLGSVSEYVLRHAHCPVLIVKE